MNQTSEREMWTPDVVWADASFADAHGRAGRLNAEYSPSITAGLVAAADSAAIILTGGILYLLLAFPREAFLPYFALSATAAAVIVAVFSLSRLYEFDALVRPTQQLKKIVLVGGLSFFFLYLALLTFSSYYAYAVGWRYGFVVAALSCIGGERWLFYRAIVSLARRGLISRNMVVVGSGPQARRALQTIRQSNEPWVRMLGVFDDRWSRSSMEVGAYPVLGNIDDLIEFGQTLRLDDIIVALPWTDEARIGRILAASRVLAANIHLGPDLAGHTFAGRPHAKRGGLFVITIAAKPLQGWLSIAKLIEDKLVALAGLVLLSPVLLASAIAVKLESPGPILFRQKRFGFNNALFDVYKFRTMYHVVRDEHAEELAHRNDARVTRVGRFLRRFSIDELPQLFNVLEGSMSIVGPRPHAVKAKAGGKLYTALANYAERHRIKPGITGWAQINGWRGETDTEAKLAGRINCDMFYIEHCSIAFDLRIILLTCFKVFSSENAY